MRVTPTGNTSGFTLFETLAATMIFATALVVLLQLFSGGLRTNAVADQYTRAVFHAREAMEALALTTQIAEPDLEGTWEDGFAWKAEINRWNRIPDAAADEEGDGQKKTRRDIPVPFQVDVEVRWEAMGKQREVTLSSVILRKDRADEQEEATQP